MDDEEELVKLRGDKKIPVPILIKRIMSYAHGHVGALILAFVLLLISVAVEIILPLIISWLVDYLEASNVNMVLSMIVGMVLGYAGLALIGKLARFLEGILLQKVGQTIVFELRKEVFTHIESMSQNQFNEMPVGSLVTRVCNYTAAISELFTSVILNVFSNLLTIVAVFAIMAILSWRLSLILFAFAVVVGVVSYFFAKVIGDKFRKERKLVSALNTFLSENLSGMRLIQIFHQEKKKDKEFSGKNEELRKAAYGVNLAFTFYRPFISFLYYVAIAVTFGVGMALAFSAGEIVAFYLYLSRFFNPVQELADQVNQIQHAFTSCERLFNLMDVEPEVVDEPDAIEIERVEGKIEFDHVWFAYEKENWILKDVSFKVEPKQTVAFCGATGAGKTTILSLIVRNYKPQKGRILIDGVDISHIKIASLRKAIGQMLQDVFLFSGTIQSNVTLHDEDFTKEQIKEACDYVNASSFIDRLPKGLDEEVAESGGNFSAGQRQLLSFARTVLHKPQILILDEATSNIDTETEILIQNSLEKMKNIGTMLVVAHRLSTIQHADNIICLQNGEIIEQGDHQSLLKKKGYYYRLYELQFANR
ncbi:MAG: ABC transporter ATP-binding protein [Bacilli bacterium]|nr:ABC transporter ATP-binding protein [Bacilli bacterium]